MGRGDSDDTLSTVGAGPALTALTAASRGASRQRRPSFPPGSFIGRYEVLEELGAGGMGVVYRAYDPDLDRQIAVKLLIARESGERTEVARERLLREAQALAQLSHPNVVAAHDVGTVGDDVFVAMELVEGRPLKDWLRRERPSQRAVIAAMVAAGRGLAAAHAAGLVHRDFKPSNVLMGAGGRPRVADFGLARAAGLDAPEDARAMVVDPEQSGSHKTGSIGRLTSTLTVAGSIMGTPGYMAPEQHLGVAVDARADQFSFCVALYEALFGERPFTGADFEELHAAVVEGRRAPVPSGIRVSRRLHRLLDRGLSVDPAQRFPSMDALLEVLDYDPAPRRTVIAVVGAGAIAVAASAVAVVSARSDAASVCAGGAERLAGVWDAEVSARVRGAFVATGARNADAAFRRLGEELDDYAADWVRERTAACEATHVRGEQSGALLDLRMACLERRRQELAAFTGVLSGKLEGAVVDQAVSSAYRLADIAACADAAQLSAREPPPADPGTRARVTRERARLDRARALELAGRYADGLEIASDVAREAGRLQYAPLTADAMHVLALLQRRTGDVDGSATSLREAMGAAAQAKDDLLLARASLDLLYTVGPVQSHYESALALGPVVDAIISRAGDAPALRADARTTLGYSSFRAGDTAAAEAELLRAQALFEEAHGPDHPLVAHALNYLAILYGSLYRFEEAQAALERALGIWERAFGPEHPSLIAGLTNLGSVLVAQNHHDEAFPYLVRGLALAEASLGPEHAKVGHALTALADVHRHRGQCDRAGPMFERAIGIYERRLGPDHVYLGYPLTGQGKCLVDAGQPDEAILRLRRAAELRKDVNDTERASTLFALARAHWAVGADRRLARSLARDSIATYRAAGAFAEGDAVEVEDWLREHEP